MKRVLIVAVCALVALAFAAMVLAETTASEKPSKSNAPMVSKKKMMGIVVSVDPAGNSIVMRSKNNDIVFYVDANTKVIRGGKTCRLSDVRVESKATIFYSGGGKKRVAVEIIAQVSQEKQSPLRPEIQPNTE